MTRMAALDQPVDRPSSTTKDWAEHERTYRGFVKGVFIFAAHVLLILLILAWIFSDSLGASPIPR
jgi:Bacterial aa3 type cytochrome c oxidase subunit IV